MEKIKIAVLVSGGGTNLQACIDAQTAGIIKSGEIALVISNKPDAYALKRADIAGIKTMVIEKSAYATIGGFEDAISAAIDGAGCELIILAGFMCILSSLFTSRYKNRIINVHPSLIPSFCGAGFYGLHVHEAALARGVKITGATVHFVNEIPDGGEIILQRPVQVFDGDTPAILQERVMREAEWIILPQAAELVSAKLLNKSL